MVSNFYILSIRLYTSYSVEFKLRMQLLLIFTNTDNLWRNDLLVGL